MLYDLLLRGGRVIDPAQGVDGIHDVAIKDARIAAVLPAVAPSSAKETIDVSGKLVLPGLIDTHAHVFQFVTGRFGLEADLCGVRSGVTTLVDQGGPSCMTLPAFREFVVNAKKSRVLAFLSSYLVGGMEGHYYPALYKPDCVDVDATVKSALENRDIVKGFKAHAELGGFARWGTEVLRKASEIAKRADLPLYIHFGQMWGLPESGANGVDPDTILEQVVPLLKPGDIIAHPFTRHPGGFVNRQGKIHPIVQEALARGLKTDVGHGSHFSFRMARIALDAGILPDTLGADMHGYNTRVPQPRGTPDSHPDKDHMFFGSTRFSLASAMSSMLALGVPLEKIVPMVTTHPAEMLRMEDQLGSLRPGVEADVSVLHDERGDWTLRDNEGNKLRADRMLRPQFCLRAGRRHDADASILPPLAQAA
ncbi:MAG TPA: amidohydrolase/deacetylase family metallohydrolase [Burkholderiales bacterium]|jgi:dihydroorotase|nr:amidohydrolase/deacetylase family metallohydrolase [Burkholderiales bacterium]